MKNTFSLMTFNIKFGLALDKTNSWDKRKESIIKALEKESPDFIGIQEVNDFQLSYINKNLTDYNYLGKYKTTNARWQDIPIFYKKYWKVLYSDHFFLSRTPNIESRFKASLWPRQAVTALFYDGKNFVCITNTHFDFKDEVQKKSVTLIKEKLKTYNSDIPLIICGDFNADPTSVCYHEFTCKTGEAPCFEDPFNNIQSATFHGFTGIPHTGRIDWILYKGKIEPLEKKIIRNSDNGQYPSDHFPVFTKFKFI